MVLGECVDVDSKLRTGWLQLELLEAAADAKQRSKSLGKGGADNENIGQSTQSSTNSIKNSETQPRKKRLVYHTFLSKLKVKARI